jgi:leucyl-tRNA synthetase
MNSPQQSRPLASYLDAAKDFEAKWQHHWQETNAFETDPIRLDQPKQVILDFFPYPSGIGLHVGHPLGYIATDVFARFRRMQGYNVLHSMGFDSFGLPAEQYAVQSNRHPRETTDENVANMLMQLRRMGLDHDEKRRFLTSDPDYYKWTQWIFLILYDSVWDPVVEWTDSLGRTVRGRSIAADELRRLLADGSRHVDRDDHVAGPSTPGARPAKPDEIDALIDKNRLAQLREVEVNWCPMLGTVLANEEVTTDGRSERGDYPVYRRPLRQWTLRITNYADRLAEDLGLLDWPTGILEMQRNWIGARDGARIDFAVEGSEDILSVFTTRPDTVYGVTFLGLAANHPLTLATVPAVQRAALDNRATDAENGASKPTIRGLQLPFFGIHPLTAERIPLFATNYVLSDYGTGAVMGVPAHDQRDFDFARQFDLPIVPVIRPDHDWLAANAPALANISDEDELRQLYATHCAAFASAYEGYGDMLSAAPNPQSLRKLSNAAGRKEIISDLETKGGGRAVRTYRLRDWIFSRQRYWGEPFPIVYDPTDDRVYALADSELPVRLPPMEDFSPITSDDPNAPVRTPLSKVVDWVTVWGNVGADGRVVLTEPNASGARRFLRDTNTMPNWAGSCWYYLRYFDPDDDTAFVAPALERYWGDGPNAIGSVDLYVGGAEHAVLHLLYARFWHKVLYDRGLLSAPEPFTKLYSQGMITADAYQDARGFYVETFDVDLRDEGGTPTAIMKTTGERVTIVKGKMGKRYKNGIPPEEVADRHSVDAYRCYMMFLGPLDATSPWREEPIVGIDRFLSTVWQMAHGPFDEAVDPEIESVVHRTIRDVTANIENLRLNTAVAALMKLVNALSHQKQAPARAHVETLVKLMAPFAPHLAEELFAACFALPDGITTVAKSPWPSYDPAKTVVKRQVVIVQVNGKVRGKLEVDADVNDSAVETLAKQDQTVARYLSGKQLRQTFHATRVQSRLVNFLTE